MSDEESFIILGTSPDASLVSGKQQVDNPGSNFSFLRSLRDSALAADTSKIALMPEEKRSLENSNNAEISTNDHTMVNSNIWQKQSDNSTEEMLEVPVNSLTNGQTVQNSTDNGVIGQNHSAPNSLDAAAAAPDSLTASFIFDDASLVPRKQQVDNPGSNFSSFRSLRDSALAADTSKIALMPEEKRSLENSNNAEISTNDHTMVNSNIWQKQSDNSTEEILEIPINSLTNGHTVQNSTDNGVIGQNHSTPNSLDAAAAAPDSLAASFILGDASLVPGKQQVDNPGSDFSFNRFLRNSSLAADTSKSALVPEEKRSLENSKNAEISTNDHTMVNSNICQKQSDNSTEGILEIPINSLTNGHTIQNSTDNGVIGQNHSAPNSLDAAAAAPDSLTASFILGEVNADVLKTSVYSQFRSLCSMEACPKNVVKLQNFLSDYVELKNAVASYNTTIRELYLKALHWKDITQQYQQQVQECNQQFAELRNENLELNTKIEQVKITDEMRQKEHDELVQANSEKTSIIENMRAQINIFKQQQLTDSKESPDYVDRLEHERVIKQFERQLSEVVAKNLDLTDVQKKYIDEITCLKVNYAAAEELIKNLQSEVNLLKTDNREILYYYSRDFEMERSARQSLEDEKEQLLLDLRTLQRKNQDLIEVDKRSSSIASSIKVLPEPSSSSASAQQQAALHRCPICSKQFQNLSFLTSHVNDCLDKN